MLSQRPERNEADAAQTPLSTWFLGPKAEQADLWRELIQYVFDDYIHWRRNYFPHDPVIISRSARRSDAHADGIDRLTSDLDRSLARLKAHFPFYSPRYVAHMLSEQSLPSVLGYFAGMLYNPNNVTEEAAPVTVQLELEVGCWIAEMLGYDPELSWTHICSGGTIANIEALWAARASQFVPFIVKEFAVEHGLDLRVTPANGVEAPIVELDNQALIGFRPDESLVLFKHLARHLVDVRGVAPKEAMREINDHVADSAFNVGKRGFLKIHQALGMQPVIFVSAAAHYSVKKAADILGYGSDSVRAVPVTPQFRMDVECLKDAVLGLADDEYIAAVLAIIGTTEEGAVDPLHDILRVRQQAAMQSNRFFWIHADAAWGGYFASLLRSNAEGARRWEGSLDGLARMHIDEAGAREPLHVEVTVRDADGRPRRDYRSYSCAWDDPEVYKSLLSLRFADSITVDPHKLGYVPYPAGVVSFRSGFVTELLAQRAQYISDIGEGGVNIAERVEIDAVGPYILEGSKPGAAALACWLAHSVVPLSRAGHGQLIRTTAIAAKRLVRHLELHRLLFEDYEAVTGVESSQPFSFVPLMEPDTNIVCFVAVPMAWRGAELVPAGATLETVNALNRGLYSRLSLDPDSAPMAANYVQQFFVSRTEFIDEQYSAESISEVLDSLGVTQDDYRCHGLFVLRSTVMNPLYAEAQQPPSSTDYLAELVQFLHQSTSAVICA